jgi:dihydrolipoamide dehydrogenase
LANQHDLLVIGAGPGGYVAAIRAAQLGLDTACIDAEAALGGTCLRVGCIPSKALLESSERYHEAGHALAAFGVKVSGVELDLARMLERKDGVVSGLTQGVAGLFKKNKVRRYHGHGRIVGPGRVVVTGPDAGEIEAKHVLIATGSKLAQLRGVELDGDRIGGSTEALSYPEVPKHLVVIGAGYSRPRAWLRVATALGANLALCLCFHVRSGRRRECVGSLGARKRHHRARPNGTLEATQNATAPGPREPHRG